jgi:alkanesulfonate monooxygenase SsuD/methylene tetrahydromethanopterin reductase-like flavin-dependent oxidoreductase (luciferase family)
MHVGLYMDLRNPPGWRRSWADHYAGALDRASHAESVGMHSIWLTEHHFFEDGYLPQPLTFAAALAARTERVRLGTGVLLAPLRTAVDIAEQAAIVDILSNGRLELGLGAGYRLPEFERFGVEMRDRFELLEQRAREVRSLWDEGGVTPPPIQVRPPLWMGVSGPRGARTAGRLGEGLLWLREDLLEPYVAGLQEAGHPPEAARMAGLVNMILADDPDQVWHELGPFALYQAETYQRYAVEGTSAADLVGNQQPRLEELRSKGPAMHPPFFDVVTPTEAVARMTSWLGDLPVVEAFFWDSIAGMPDSLVNRHIELLATELAPAVAGLGTG